eukprot:1156863-Pelagomonas_calceolata.AAC.3
MPNPRVEGSVCTSTQQGRNASFMEAGAQCLTVREGDSAPPCVEASACTTNKKGRSASFITAFTSGSKSHSSWSVNVVRISVARSIFKYVLPSSQLEGPTKDGVELHRTHSA